MIKISCDVKGLPQFIQLGFTERVIPSRLSLTFQGGFVGTRCAVYISSPIEDDGTKQDWQLLTNVYPEDVNRRQTFDLPSISDPLRGLVGMKLIFEESSDFFGRITVYDLKVEGSFVT